MNSDIKQAWIDALRSGRYKQGKGRLKKRHMYKPTDNAYEIVVTPRARGSLGESAMR